jgi:hypothetical protein
MSRVQLSDNIMRQICAGKHPVATGLQIRVKSVLRKKVHFQLQAVDVDGEVLTEIGTREAGAPVAQGNTLTLTTLAQLFVINIGQGAIGK